jgi:hypothetical protein
MATHSYLGDGLETIRRRTFLNEGDELELMLLPLVNVRTKSLLSQAYNLIIERIYHCHVIGRFVSWRNNPFEIA